jgi:hypothetical protein
MLLSRHQNAGQNHNMKTPNRSENVAKFRYLGTTVTNQNLIQEKIKRRLNLGNACYHSVQNILSSRLLSKNLKIRIQQKTFFSCGSYGCEPWSPTLREEHRLRRLFGPKRDEVTGDWRELHTEELRNFYSSPSIVRMNNSRRIR